MALPKTRLTTERINRDDFLRRCQGEKTETYLHEQRTCCAGRGTCGARTAIVFM